MLKRLALGLLLLASGAPPAFLPGAAAPAPAEEPALALKVAPPPAKPGKAQLFVFEGTYPAPVHRAGPEHFKLTRLSDGKAIELTVTYDRDALEDVGQGCPRAPKERVPRERRDRMPYNHLFKGARLSLDSGLYDAKDREGRAGLLDLYARAKLEPGVRYRLTWACWPVGAKEATEASCAFELAK